MSKHELNKAFFANAKMIHPDNYSGISELFKAWSLASGRANDRTISDANQADAAGKMEEYWDAARAFTAKSAADVAAIYIMGQNTATIETDAYLESAWLIVHAASGEADLVQLYETWVHLRATPNALDLDDKAGDGIYAIAAKLEAKMAAIPATTAKGLAVKVDVFGGNVETNPGRISLNRDLAALTGQDVRPE